jgi:hypothetical protein
MSFKLSGEEMTNCTGIHDETDWGMSAVKLNCKLQKK